MGKGQRNKAKSAATFSAAKENKSKSGKLALQIICAVLAVVIVGGLVIYGKVVNNGYFLRRTVALSSENYEISNAEMSYFFHTTYSNALSNSQNAYMFVALGLNTSKPLKSQYVSSSTQTWFDYFMTQSVSSAKQLLVLCEAAKAAGVTLDDDDLKAIDTEITALKTAAKNSGVSETYYVRNVYGAGVKLSDVKEAVTLQKLASKYYNQIQDELAERFTKEDYDKYFEENPDKLLYADILTYTFTYTPDKKDTTSTATKEDTKYTEDKTQYAHIQKYAEELAATKNAEEFEAYVRKYITEVLYEGYEIIDDTSTDTTTATATTDKKDTTATGTKEDKKTVKQSVIDKAVDAITKDRQTHTKDNEVSDFIFNDETKLYETHTSKSFDSSSNEYSVTVTMVSATKYRDEYATRSFAHILLGVGNYGSYEKDADAKEKADAVLAEFKAGENTQKAFEALAEKYNDDSGVVYENVSHDQMVSEVEDWLFDDARKDGDVDIVKTQYGYHVMFYIGEGKVAWELQADELLIKETYDEMYKEFTKAHSVKVDSAALSQIDA